MSFGDELERYRSLTENAVKQFLGKEEMPYLETIYNATRYSVLAGGKRLRPALMMGFCEMCGGKAKDVLPFAAALEMIHTYSLIHDDLPCMDNDDLRRGKPTNHKIFGEATAVLAGDALLTRAFETVADRNNTPGLAADTVLLATSYLARAAGMDGMIGGQIIDLEAEHQTIDMKKLIMLQQLKTGCLIQVAAVIGTIVAGKTNEKYRIAAESYGCKLGLAFQIQDDILDVEGDASTLGKTVGKDAVSEKSTFVSLLGIEKCREMVHQLTEEAINALTIFENNSFLSALAENLVGRKS